MTATNHVVMGALVATYIHNPWIAIPVAVASHFVLDAIPHFGYPGINYLSLKFMLILAVDSAIAASILISLFMLQPAGFVLLVICAIAAASPDLMWLYYLIIKKDDQTKKRPAIVRFHSKIQHEYPKLLAFELVWFVLTGSLLASRLY